MIEWIKSLSIMEHIYLWLGVASTLFLIVQIIMMCFSSFGGDVDLDGDGDIDVDTDSGVSIFTVKSITAFLAVGSWVGLLMCTVLPALQWLSVIIALIAGVAGGAIVVVLMHFMVKLQSNGIVNPELLVGKRATVYVTVPASRSGRGKVTLNAQGKYMELDAVTDGSEKLACDETVEIVSTENECMVVKRLDFNSENNKGE